MTLTERLKTAIEKNIAGHPARRERLERNCALLREKTEKGIVRPRIYSIPTRDQTERLYAVHPPNLARQGSGMLLDRP